MIELTWVDKYNPECIGDMVLSAPIKEQMLDLVKSNKLSNMTFAGIQGIGKTTLATVLAKELNAIVFFNPCGDKKSVDDVTGDMTTFCDSETIDDRIKVVILDEADQLSGGDRESSAQKSLKGLIERAQDDTRFILTCNHQNQIFPAILSRCPIINIKYNGKDVMKRIKYILDTEGVKYTKTSLKEFIDVVVKPNYPDIRKMINLLEPCCASGELKLTSMVEHTTELEEFVVELLEEVRTNADLNAIRRKVIQNTAIFNNNYTNLGSMIFNDVVQKSNDVKLLKNLTHFLYKMQQVSDPEIQLFGMLLEMKK
jgi:DNA polymerase III delta prime subunit